MLIDATALMPLIEATKSSLSAWTMANEEVAMAMLMQSAQRGDGRTLALLNARADAAKAAYYAEACGLAMLVQLEVEAAGEGECRAKPER